MTEESASEQPAASSDGRSGLAGVASGLVETAALRLLGGRAALWTAVGATLIPEIGFVAWLFGIFGARAPAVGVLDMPAELITFVAALLLSQLLLLGAFYWLLWRLHRRRSGPLLSLDFLFVSLAGFALILTAKAELIRFFGINVDLAMLRALSGGTLAAALAYAWQEAAALLTPVAVAIIAYVIVRPRLARRWRAGAEPSEPRRRLWSIAALALPPLLFVAGSIADARRALERFTAPWIGLRLLEQLSDLDRDGYSLFSRPRDPFPFDAARHPFALDIPGNGIDEDGLAGDFRHVPRPPVQVRFGPTRRHVVLIVLESTRADAVGKTWSGRLVAPNLTRMALEGSAAQEAYSHFTVTAHSLKAIFSGDVGGGAATSLFRDFNQAGYRVGALSTMAVDFAGIADAAGMRENSDVIVDPRSLRRGAPTTFSSNATLVVDGREMLRAMDQTFGAPGAWRQPTFLYFNFQAPHHPYAQPGMPQLLPGRPIPRREISAANKAWVARTYWNAVAFADWLVGQVASRLRSLGVYHDSVIAVVGDHGEELFENGRLGHGQGFDVLQTQVPMLFSTRGLDIPRPVGLADLRALLLHAAGASVSPRPGGEPVLQFSGTLDRPNRLAMVERGGRWTILDLASGEVRSDGIAERGEINSLSPGSALRGKAERLVLLWERARWERHLRERGR